MELKNFYYGQKVGLKIKGEKNVINWLIKNKYLAKAEMKRIDFETDLAKFKSHQYESCSAELCAYSITLKNKSNAQK